MKRDADESELLESVERGEWKPVADAKRALAEELPYQALSSRLPHTHALGRLRAV